MKRFMTAAVAAALTMAAAPARAAEADIRALTAAVEGMRAQIAELQATVAAQNARIQRLEAGRADGAAPLLAAPSTDARAKDAAAASVREQVETSIPWLKGVKYGGDLRLRQEYFDFSDKNNDAGSTGTANDRSRNRFRFRLRWGLEKELGDDWKAGFRLASGNATDNTSTNVTLGNPGYFTFKTILIDRAYAIYTPSALKGKGALDAVTVGAGKVDNPFQRYSTGIVWDTDVTPEGLYEKATFALAGGGATEVKVDATLGQFLANENAGVESDAQVFAYQGVLRAATTAIGGGRTPVELAFAVAYYDYPNWFQTVTSNSAGVSFLRTNTLVADDFRVVDLYPEIQFDVASLPVTLWGDYAFNAANVGTDDLAGSGGNDVHDSDQAWGIGFKLGKAEKKDSWEFHYGYYEIGVNAVVAAYNDADFGGPGYSGHTNRMGHRLGAGYQLTDNVLLNGTVSFVEPLHPSVAVGSSTNEDVLRAQLDFNYKF